MGFGLAEGFQVKFVMEKACSQELLLAPQDEDGSFLLSPGKKTKPLVLLPLLVVFWGLEFRIHPLLLPSLGTCPGTT